MKIETFRGRTMSQTLGQVKRALGPNAVIITTRTLKGRHVLGLGSKPMFEITAARQLSDLPVECLTSKVPQVPRQEHRADGAAMTMSTDRKSTDPSLSQNLLWEMGELKRAVHAMVRQTRHTQLQHGSGELYAAYERLVRGQVADELAQQIVADIRSSLSAGELSDPDIVQRKLVGVVESMLPVAGAVELSSAKSPTVIALVGPTGVGKTTTIAKLAANFALRYNKCVGLITIDTYRIAAVEQLRTYAEIIGVPLEVVTSPSELRDAVARMSNLEVVLIDTAGRGQRDAGKISELKSFFDKVTPDEIHLVLSTTSGQEVLAQAMERFRPLSYGKVIFTKLDEAVGFGVMLACLQGTHARLSYVTMGQNVPDDIRAGEGSALARLISGGRTSGQRLGDQPVDVGADAIGAVDVTVGDGLGM